MEIIPSYYFRYNSQKIPIYRTPFTKENFQSLIYMGSKIDKFGIHDQQTGKVNFYSMSQNRMPVFNSFFNSPIKIMTITKGFGILILGYWSYKLATIGRKIKKSTKSNVSKISKAVHNWEEMVKIKSPKNGTKGTNDDNSSISSPNGWTISNIIPKSDLSS